MFRNMFKQLKDMHVLPGKRNQEINKIRTSIQEIRAQLTKHKQTNE